MASQLRDFASSVVVVVVPETTALVVAQLMRQHHVGAIVVVDADNKSRPVGIVTDRDLVLELMAEGLEPAVFTAGDIMSVDLVLARPDMDVMEAVRLMSAHGKHRLVLVDESERLVGIVAVEDLLELFTRELANFAAGVAAARDREIRQRAL